jgi:hypothetical protein
VTTRDRDYHLMMSALADVTRRRDADLESAERAYQDNAARAAGELARAEGEAADADRWAGAAAAQVLDVDREAERLWDQLRKARGVRVRALGELPEPAPVEALPRVALQRRPPETKANGPRPRVGARTAGPRGRADRRHRTTRGPPTPSAVGASAVAGAGCPGRGRHRVARRRSRHVRRRGRPGRHADPGASAGSRSWWPHRRAFRWRPCWRTAAHMRGWTSAASASPCWAA